MQIPIEQPLPQDIEAEMSLLGAIISKNDSILDVIDFIKPDDFYKDSHKIIYKAMVDMYNKSIGIDPITLGNALGTENLQVIGGATYISNLITITPSSSNIKNYAKIVKEKSDRRKIIKSCEDALGQAFNNDNKTDTKEIINSLEEKLLYVGINSESRILTDSELMEKTLNMIQVNYQNGGDITGISTGYKGLDYVTNGLIKGDFIILAGRPSMGKTCLALNIANNVPKENNIALFELEMSAEKLGARRLAAKSLINATKLPRGKLEPEEWTRVVNNSSLIAGKNNIFTDTTAGQTAQDIRAKCKKIKLKHGLDIVIIDHLTLITPVNLKESRVNQISEITRNLKNMAKDLNIAVICLSQLSRAPEQRSDHRPMLSDLRESGSIEQDADLVMFLYRDEYYNKDTDKKGILECIIAKQRDGRIGTIELSYQPEYQLITEMSDYKCIGTYDPKIFDK